jgi:hypothetical protein
MKKLAFIFIIVTAFFSRLQADFWKVEDVYPSSNGFLLVMDNQTIWRVELNQLECIQEIMNWTEKEIISKGDSYFIGDIALEKFFQGDRVVLFDSSDGRVIFEDMDSKALLCCFLKSYPQNVLSTIVKLDTNGYFITLSDGSEWTISWISSWTSYGWKLGDCVIPIKKRQGDCLINLTTSEVVLSVNPLKWKS